MLVKKQNIKHNEQWLDVWKECTNTYSREDIEKLEQDTIKMIQQVTKGYKNICSGWCGGKDSQVLHSILVKSGIQFTPIMWRDINEFPCVVDWLKLHAPSNIMYDMITKFDFKFLENNPDYLFRKNNTRQAWMAETWRCQKKFISKLEFDLFIVGRRLKDGNVCGNKQSNYIRHKNEYDTFSPLAEWNHEQILAYIKYNYLPLPPTYYFKKGFKMGTLTGWTEYTSDNGTDDEVWNELYQIDKSIVINAANHLTSAKRYLERKQIK